MEPPKQMADHLVDADNIADRLKIDRGTVWKRCRKYELQKESLPPGAYRVGTRNLRFDAVVFVKWWLLKDESPADPLGLAKPAPPAEAQEPTRRDAMNLLRADLTRLEGKLDSGLRALLAAIRNGKRK